MNRHLHLLVILCLIFSAGYAQQSAQSAPQASWPEMMHDQNVNFYDVQKEFNRWKADNSSVNAPMDADEEEGEDGSELYYRWANIMAPRVYPTGVRPDPILPYFALQEYKKLIGNDKVNSTGNWTPLGPNDYNGINPSDGIGMGRVNGSAVDLNDTNNIYLATPGGGLWNSKDAGATWVTTTDHSPTLCFQHVAIDPNNSNIIYAGSGDAENTIISPYGVGVLKSTDAGATWFITGLNWSNLNSGHVHKIIIDPTNSNIVLAATDQGLYRTMDAGAAWVRITPTNMYDIRFKPTDPNTVYAASGTQFYRSTDNGLSFPSIYTVSGSTRITIAVTPANPNYVYLVSALATTYGFNGLYQSTDGGSTFTQMSSTPNILGSKSDGSGTGVQGWYDLAIAVSPVNANLIFVGGVNMWKSTNGGVTWSIVTYSNHKTAAPYVHVDFHSLDFYNGTLYACSDGGFFKTNNLGATWTDLSAGLQIAQFYHIGGFPANPNVVYAGAQDNGSDKYYGGATWSHVDGADGFRPHVDFTDSNIVYTSHEFGKLFRSRNAGVTFDSINNGITGTAAWDTPFMMDPVTPTTLYCGYGDLWKSVDSGNTWNKISNISSANMTFISVAPSNPQTIYIGFTSSIFRTTDGGANWSGLGGLPSLAPTALAISPTDPLKIWVTFSGYSATGKVYASKDGGTTWTNYSGYLPNIPVESIIYQNGSKDGLYIGMDQGIYYRDSTSTNWQPFMTGLPNVMVRDFEINYVNNKIRASTFGRGLWESDLFTGSAPVAAFTVSNPEICNNDTVTFTDISYNNPTSHTWSFPGGNPSSSTVAQPVVSYSSPGTYTVKLTISNTFGSDSITKVGYVVVSPDPVVTPFLESFESIAFPDNSWLVHDIVGGSTWELTSTAAHTGSKSIVLNNLNGNPPDEDWFITPSFDLSFMKSVSLTFYMAFAEQISTTDNKLTVSASNDCGTTWSPRLTLTGANISTNGGTLVTSNFIPQSSEWKLVTVNLASSFFSGRPNVKIKFDFINKTGNNFYVDDINISGIDGINELNSSNFTISPNPFHDLVSIGSKTNSGKDVEIGIYNVVGEKIYTEKYAHPSGSPMIVDMSGFSSGVYFVNIKDRDNIETHKVIKIASKQ